LRESFLGCLIPYPGGPTACICLFLPLCHRPYPAMAMGRLPANDPLETTSCGVGISGRQIFLYVQASKFVLPPRSSLPLRILPQGSRGFYVRAERASLPPHAPDILTVRIQAIDGTRTFTSLNSRPCRPLPIASSRSLDADTPEPDGAVSSSLPSLGYMRNTDSHGLWHSIAPNRAGSG